MKKKKNYGTLRLDYKSIERFQRAVSGVRRAESGDLYKNTE